MNNPLQSKILERLRDVPDFPKEGIIFKDITPMLLDCQLMGEVTDALCNICSQHKVTKIAGIEARGFIFGSMVSLRGQIPFLPIRKAGKLPWKTKKISYSLEYGESTIEMHEDAVCNSDRVVIVDDLLATGGTTKAACELITSLGASVVLSAFVLELGFLSGRAVLEPIAPVVSLVTIQ